MSWHLPPQQSRALTTCAVHGYPKSGGAIRLACPNAHMNKIIGVRYANWGNSPSNRSDTPLANSEDCAASGELVRNSSSKTVGCGFDLAPVLSQACAGKEACEVECGQSDSSYKNCLVDGALVNTTGARHFGPGGSCTGKGAVLSAQLVCPSPLRTGTVLAIDVSVPPNSRATTRVPLLGASAQSVEITEAGAILWSQAGYRPGVAGVTGVSLAEDDADVLVINHGSGEYTFERSDVAH